MPISIDIDRAAWKAAYAAASINDARTYLNGVWLDLDAPGNPVIMGTDGGILVTAPVEAPHNATGQYMLPHIKGVRFTQAVDFVTVTLYPDSPNATIKHAGKPIVVNREFLTAEKMPTWASVRRTVGGDGSKGDNESLTGDRLVFDPLLIANITAALQVRGFRSAQCCQFIPGAGEPSHKQPMRVVIADYPSLAITLMPCRI